MSSGAEFYALTTSIRGKTIKSEDLTGSETTVADLSPGETYVFSIVPVGKDDNRGAVSTTIIETTSRFSYLIIYSNHN